MVARHDGAERMLFHVDSHGCIVTPSELDKLILKFVDSGNDLFLDAQVKGKDFEDSKRDYVRDQAALAAAKCMLPNYKQAADMNEYSGQSELENSLKDIAQLSYFFADAMLSARNK